MSTLEKIALLELKLKTFKSKTHEKIDKLRAKCKHDFDRINHYSDYDLVCKKCGLVK
jgi:hypothetical protein